MSHEVARGLTRRSLLRSSAGAALAALPMLALAGKAEAGRAWCRLDPTFLIDGYMGNVYVSGLIDRNYDVTGPTELIFTVPPGVTSQLIDADQGFGMGYKVTHATSSKLRNRSDRIEIQVSVRVPAKTSDLPILVEFVPNGSVESPDHQDGKTNQWITVSTEIRKAKSG
jgi:hypothetical protein